MKDKYHMLMESGAAKWYKETTKEDIVSPIINMKKVVTTEAFKNYLWEILSRITQFKIDNRDTGECLEKRKDLRNDYNCKCAGFKIIQHVVNHCQGTQLKREMSLGASAGVDSAQLINTPKGLQIQKYFPWE